MLCIYVTCIYNIYITCNIYNIYIDMYLFSFLLTTDLMSIITFMKSQYFFNWQIII